MEGQTKGKDLHCNQLKWMIKLLSLFGLRRVLICEGRLSPFSLNITLKLLPAITPGVNALLSFII